MSKIIRNVIEAPSVFIGDKQYDYDQDRLAEEKLAKLFPLVSLITDPDGVRFIPIKEIFQIETTHQEYLEQANQKGYQTGYDAGVKKGLEEARKVLAQFNTAIQAAVDQRAAILEEARVNVLDLILKICQKVTFSAIEADPEVVLKMISGVIDSLVDKSNLKIKVNPQHLPIIEQNIDRFLDGSTTIKEIKIEADPRVKQGGCFIETPSGDIDARLDSQFEVIKDILHKSEDAGV